jgi:DNA-binding transcriptional LysR family regulator
LEYLTEMMTFAKVVELKSFSEAARALGSSKSLVSKQITTLESALGIRLLNRTTRRMSLTDIGSAYYEHCLRIANEIDAARQTASQFQIEPRGILKVTAPIMFASLHLPELIGEFVKRYPQVALELDTSDRVIDLVDEGFDLAIRISRSPAPGTVVRKIAGFDVVTCAAPAYVALHGAPTSPGDLRDHNCLVYHPSRAHIASWEYSVGKKVSDIAVAGNCRVNSMSVLRSLVLSGVGIGVFPRYLVGTDLRDGHLVALLEEFAPPPGNALYLTFMPNRYMQPKVRAFIDHVTQWFGETPPWLRP